MGRQKHFLKNVYNKLIMEKRHYQDNCEYPRKRMPWKCCPAHRHKALYGILDLFQTAEACHRGWRHGSHVASPWKATLIGFVQILQLPSWKPTWRWGHHHLCIRLLRRRTLRFTITCSRFFDWSLYKNNRSVSRQRVRLKWFKFVFSFHLTSSWNSHIVPCRTMSVD